jgi:hypothetical protein
MVEITQKEYAEIFAKQKLTVLESFSDPDGELPYGYFMPAFDTIWGVGEEKIVMCEQRKKNRGQEEWDVKYYKF